MKSYESMEGKEQALERAKQFLKSAEACWREEALAGCALCCYAAMFWAAIAVLMHVGLTARKKWKHGDVWQLFGLEIVKKRQLVPERLGEWLEDAYDLRNDAQYNLEAELSRKKVERTLRHAREFIAEIDKVIKR
ncbi:MAG: HEPN domain-containing protein [Armatimonadota bacterium]